MPGSGRGKKREEALPPPKEKPRAMQAQIRAENQATGQQGMASAAAARASYGLSSVVG
ncbi:MAG: hypothetical protein GY847_22255 [Proteobacteria bacterium]|nr:hypothetical protein [Pseudomonadota bacterium]